MQREKYRDDEQLATSLGPAMPTRSPLSEESVEPAATSRGESDVNLSTRPITKADFDHIVRVIDKWWGGPTSALAHPMFFYELGETAMVVEESGTLVGFLLGFVAPRGPCGYVHLVGIHPEYRRKQVGTKLYRAFEETCRAAGCVELKAITTAGNEGSVRFHEAQGWSAEQVDDYAGPGRDRVVFRKPLRA